MLQPSEKSGIKMTIKFGQAGNSSEHILYLLDDRKRMEFRNLRSQPGLKARKCTRTHPRSAGAIQEKRSI
jgi:hypothetical protein